MALVEEVSVSSNEEEINEGSNDCRKYLLHNCRINVYIFTFRDSLMLYLFSFQCIINQIPLIEYHCCHALELA